MKNISIYFIFLLLNLFLVIEKAHAQKESSVKFNPDKFSKSSAFKTKKHTPPKEKKSSSPFKQRGKSGNHYKAPEKRDSPSFK